MAQPQLLSSWIEKEHVLLPCDIANGAVKIYLSREDTRVAVKRLERGGESRAIGERREATHDVYGWASGRTGTPKQLKLGAENFLSSSAMVAAGAENLLADNYRRKEESYAPTIPTRIRAVARHDQTGWPKASTKE
jgi:hypothetical protein